MKTSIATVAVSLCCCLMPLAGGAAEVRVRSAASCSAAIVRLIDVAEIHDNDHRLIQALADIPLFPGPPIGTSRSVSRQDLAQLIALSGVERSVVQLTGSESVTITSDGTTGGGSLAKRSVAVAGVRQAAFEVETKGKTTSRQAESKPGEGTQKQVGNMPPSADSTQRVETVERGEGVTVHANTGGIRVTTSGKALAAGATGETIGVELADSKQRILARIVAPQVVEVAVGHPAMPAETKTR